MTGNDEWAKLEEQEAAAMPVMSAEKFERVKIAQSHDIPADTIARELGLPLTEVNAEFLKKSYEAYRQ